MSTTETFTKTEKVPVSITDTTTITESINGFTILFLILSLMAIKIRRKKD